MGAVGLKVVIAAVLVVGVAVSGLGVSGPTHHVVGDDNGWGPDLDVGSWVSGRVFRVGDKIWFKNSGTEDTVVELQGLEEFQTCNLTNPIRMYTDPVSHVTLEKEGARYFTSANPENCKNGLKLPVPVQPTDEYPPFQFGPPPPEPFDPPHTFGPPPPEPFDPSPPEPFDPPHTFGPPPPEPFDPPHTFGPPPPEPFDPPHKFGPPPPEPFYPPPPRPSAGTRLNGLSIALFAVLSVYYCVGI